MRTFYLSLFSVLAFSSNALSQQQYAVLGMPISQVRFILQKEGVKLDPEVVLDTGKKLITYTRKRRSWEKVDLLITRFLYFNVDGICDTIIDSSMREDVGWVSDTLINRLKRIGFEQRKTYLYYNPELNCGASFEHIHPLDAKTKKELLLNIVQVTYWTVKPTR